MRNAGLEETQAGIKIAGRNINNFRYADDTTLMAESEEELKSLLMKMEENSEKSWLKTKQPNQKMGQRSKQTFLLAILIPACVSSSPAFLMMYSA